MRPVPNYNVIKSFNTPETRFLSNFYPCTINWTGQEGKIFKFPSVENAYQAMKCPDEATWEFFTKCTPAQARAYGQKQRTRLDWETAKVITMGVLLRIKFSVPEFKASLKETGKALLVEGNEWHDSFWGFNVIKGFGQNMLGQLLMQIRMEP